MAVLIKYTNWGGPKFLYGISDFGKDYLCQILVDVLKF